jgi:hypothetical protein
MLTPHMYNQTQPSPYLHVSYIGFTNRLGTPRAAYVPWPTYAPTSLLHLYSPRCSRWISLYAYELQYGRPVAGSRYLAGYDVMAHEIGSFLCPAKGLAASVREVGEGERTGCLVEFAVEEDLRLDVFALDGVLVEVG